MNQAELYHYLRRALSRKEPYPIIDHSIRAQLNADQSISFYIHPTGIDGETKDFVLKLPGAPTIDREALQKLLDEKHGDSLGEKPRVSHQTAKCTVYWRRFGRDLDQKAHRKLLGEIPNVHIAGEFKEENRNIEVTAYCYVLEPTFPESYWAGARTNLIPSDCYPLPEVPEGFRYWEYRGIDWRCDSGPPVTFANCPQRITAPVEWDIHHSTYPEGMGHYLQAMP